ncbi:glycosyltransferase [Pedobacter sp. HMF7647]|uniref:Glycosyltransferase n=1 Tax=Hufsiella arboris TaxID=2695275 RepID=A0A7K1YFK8_9SPHI|nr:glycosyltransferase family 2 protein [Hufsiella arboris]MXV52759.1 glycosyltransferase [Hufsiella arboris]
MKVSIITVTYNAERFLEKCIKSVLSQSYQNIEYIIIDGESTDSTLSVIEPFRSHIPKVISEKDDGMYDALNKGISLAQGDIIGILNADDFFASDDVVEKIVQSFEKSGAEVLYGDLDYVDQFDTNKILRKWRTKRYFKGAFQWGWMPAHPTFYAKKSLFENYGAYNPQFGSAADYELMLRYMHKFKVKSVFLQEVLVKMRNGGMSNSSLGNRIKANKKDLLAMKVNQIQFPLLAAIMKPLRKVPQFIGF